MIDHGYIQGKPVILDFIRINTDLEYVVKGEPYSTFNDAWTHALGMWQASRFGVSSDNTNMSDAEILREINQDIQSILTIKEMENYG